MNYCYAITGVFVPTNMPMSLLSYKYLRGLNMPVDVVAMNHTVDQSLVEKLSKDPKYKNMHVSFKGQYNDALFSIHNINLFKALKNVNRYIDRAIEEFDKDKYNYLFTSSFPAFTTRAGKAIKDKYPDVTWIASFTDPINHSPYKSDARTYHEYSLPEKVAFNLYCKYYVNDHDEILAFNHADYFIFICEEQRDYMIEQYLKTETKYTREDLLKKSIIFPLNYIPEWNDITKLSGTKKNDVFTFAHFGRVYGLRDATAFIEAVNELVEEGVKPFIVKQYGEFRKSDKKLIHKYGLDAYFEIHDQIPYKDAIEEMNRSDILLIFDTIMSDDEIQPYLPSKILEYSLLEKNTLTISTPKSPSFRIARASEALVCENKCDAIKETLRKAFTVEKSVIKYHATNDEAAKALQSIL